MMSYFWDNKVDKIYRIRFAKKDNKEEFMDYISKLMVDQFWYLFTKPHINTLRHNNSQISLINTA